MEFSTLESARAILLAHNETFLANALCAKQLQNDHRNHERIFQLGMCSFKGHRFEAAKVCFSQLRRLTGSFDAHYYFARSCESLDDLDLAKEAYLDAILVSTFNLELLFEAYKNLGNLFLRDKNIDMAEDFYHKAYALSPDSPQIFVNLGTLEMQKGNPSLAIEKFRRALQINPKFAAAWVGMALAYQSFGEFEMAWASLLKSLETAPNNQTALLLLATWSSKNDAIDFAVEQLMNYFDGGHLDNQLSLAFIELCIQSSKFSLARLEIERALLWDPSNLDLLKFEKALSDHGY